MKEQIQHKKQTRSFSYLLLSLYLGIFAVFFSAKQLNAKELFKAEVAEVIDGDTIKLKDGRLINYVGINAPELRRKVDSLWVYDPEPFAEDAAKLNKKLVEGKEVLIEVDPAARLDKQGHLMAHVYVDKVLVNEELLRAGLAKTDTPSLAMKHRIRLWSREQIAWENKRGLWGAGGNAP